MAQNTPAVYKENGVKQRDGVALDLSTAIALRNRIFSGKTLYPTEGKIQVPYIGENGEECTKEVGSATINAWIARNNVIPETGETLRVYLDNARIEYRNEKLNKRRENIVELAESRIERALKIRTNLPVRNMFGQTIVENGRIVRKENHNLLRVQIDAAKYATERLASDRWGRVEKGEHKHLVFSLSDLRKAREEQENAS